MKISMILHYIVGGILLLNAKCLAQSGYNYVRPDGAAANAGATLPTTAIRPIVAAYPTSSGPSGIGGIPTAVTGFAAPISPSITPTTQTAFSPFAGGQAQRLTPTTAVGAYPATATGAGASGGSLVGRPLPTQRTSTGSNAIFGAMSGTAGATQTRFGINARGSTTGSELEFEGDGDFSAIPGVPGVDYPIYSQVPQTSFDCVQQPLPGYYSDVEAQCQVFHICALNRTYSFLCPNGTVFSQETLVCVWWNQYDCISAPSLYANNAFIYDYSIQGGSNNAEGFGSGSRAQQNGFAIPSARPVGSATSQASGIFGANAGNLRPTVTSGSFSGLTSSIGTTPTNVFTAAGARAPTANRVGLTSSATPQQTFPTTSSVITPVTPFRGSNAGSGTVPGTATSGGNIAGQSISGPENAFGNTQLATSTTNREYLPPRRP